jgi:uncharacterized protein (DUF1015 family)
MSEWFGWRRGFQRRDAAGILTWETQLMTTIRAFRALRPSNDRAALTSAVPYDVVNTSEARQLARGNPFSFLHVSRPEIDLPDGTDPYSDEVYHKAAGNFARLKREVPLSVEATPGLYVYRLRMGTHEQNGIAAVCSVDEYDRGLVRKHEKTRKDKEDDRTRHILTLRAQTGPVFLTYRDQGEVDSIVSQGQATEPLYDFEAPDSVHHTLWSLSADLTGQLERAFETVPLLYIADGHHRAASASRAAAELKGQNPHHSGTEDYNFFIAVLFPASQVQILPYNRLVKDLNGLTPDGFLSALSSSFTVTEDAPPSPVGKGDISMYLDGRWYGLRTKSSGPASAVLSLDVSVLENQVLDPLLGIKDVRTDKRIDFAGGIRGASYLKQQVDDGKAAVAFSMFPVTVQQLMDVADADLILPPKSTWFEPKLRDGLLIHTI